MAISFFYYFYPMVRGLLFLYFFLTLFPVAEGQVRDLDYYLQAGMTNSPLLKDLHNQRRINSYDSLFIAAGRKPQVGFNGLLYYAPILNGYGYSEAITNGGAVGSQVVLSQDLFRRKSVEAQFTGMGLQNQALSNTIALTENDIRKSITAQYLIAYAVYSEIGFTTKVLATLREEDTILKRLVEGGIYRQTDYLSFLVEMQSQEITLNQLQIDLQKETSALNLLCGITSDSVYELIRPDIEQKALIRWEQTTFFLRFKYDSLLIRNEKMLLDRSYKPSVRWFGDAGLLSNNPPEMYKNFGVSLGLSMTFPLYDGNKRKLGFDKLNTLEETRRYYEDFYRTQYDQQLLQLNEELSKTRAMIPRLQEQAVLAARVIRDSRTLIDQGALPVTDYVIALRNYMTIQHNLHQYGIKILQIINEINYWKQ
jgi:outer membrane protein TolC